MPKTYNDRYLATRTALKNAGVEAYALEARLLVAYAVGKTKEEFVRDLRLYTSDENEQKIEALLQRRIAGEPLAYLIGEWEFHGLPIVVTPDVLIPRMDTEVLVDAALRVLVGRKMNARILDLCSGSGCIGCALAHELPAARVVMVDISDEALTVSKENLRRNHQNRTICLKADALEKPPMGIGTFDLIVSNPPYVASMDILTLDSSVRDYEPLGALDGGEDGLMFYRAIVRHWTQILRPGGWLMFEVGEDQAAAVMALMTEEKYTDVTALEDTAGIRRKTRVEEAIARRRQEKEQWWGVVISGLEGGSLSGQPGLTQPGTGAVGDLSGLPTLSPDSLTTAQQPKQPASDQTVWKTFTGNIVKLAGGKQDSRKDDPAPSVGDLSGLTTLSPDSLTTAPQPEQAAAPGPEDSIRIPLLEDEEKITIQPFTEKTPAEEQTDTAGPRGQQGRRDDSSQQTEAGPRGAQAGRDGDKTGEPRGPRGRHAGRGN